jgi:hypothetical protein
MADEENSASLFGGDFAHFAEALPLECRVTDREDFIDE